MTDQHYTHTCQHCNKPYYPRAAGAEQKYCTPDCRSISNRKKVRVRQCGECASDYEPYGTASSAKGFCSPHCMMKRESPEYRSLAEISDIDLIKNVATMPCQVCGKPFESPLKIDRTIRKRKYRACSKFCYSIAAGRRSPDTEPCRRPQYGVKVMVCCKFCKSFFGPLLPGQARKVMYCSKQCVAGSQSHKQLPDGTWVKPSLPCAYCGEDFETSRHKVKFCSKSCSASYNLSGYTKAVWPEVKALRAIADNVRARKPKPPKTLVELESDKLKAISKAISLRIIQCSICKRSHVKRRPYMMQCSAECEQAHQEEKAQRRRDAVRAWKNTPKGRASRSAGKAARRSRIKETKVEKIDPIAVFENANWVCHICGDKTLKSKRGTYHDRAPELEHIVALANGGTHTWSNVACACRKCNIEKGAKDYGQMGLL